MDKSYTDPGGDIYGLWLVNVNGEMFYLSVPIRVMCIMPVKDFYPGIIYYVEAVLGSERGHIVFFIFQKPVNHSYFQVIEHK